MHTTACYLLMSITQKSLILDGMTPLGKNQHGIRIEYIGYNNKTLWIATNSILIQERQPIGMKDETENQ